MNILLFKNSLLKKCLKHYYKYQFKSFQFVFINKMSYDKEKVFTSCIKEIMSNDAPFLDIGDQVGSSGYIDFIMFEDVSSAFSKGRDKFNRPFFVLRVRITTTEDAIIDTLETFFQRYSDNESLWMGCGHDRVTFLSTEGGMKIEQIKFVNKLIKEGKIDITEEIKNEISFSLYSMYGSVKFKDSETIKTIELL